MISKVLFMEKAILRDPEDSKGLFAFKIVKQYYPEEARTLALQGHDCRTDDSKIDIFFEKLERLVDGIAFKDENQMHLFP